MKKILLTIFGAMSFIESTGQIATLEHSYVSSYMGDGPESFATFVTDSGFQHLTYDDAIKTISIYNSAHSLVKTVVLPIPNSDVFDIVATDKLFNSDSTIEFLLRTFINGDNAFVIVNDEGTLLQTFENRNHAAIYKAGNTYKLILNLVENNTTPIDVYSLAGTLSVDQQTLLTKNGILAPNPTSGAIVIRGTVAEGQTENIEIYNTTGQKVMQQMVTGTAEGVTIDVTGLSSGIYTYKVAGQTRRFIKN